MSVAGAIDLGDVDAILFDLDDTLFLQAAWLEGAWATVATSAVGFGVSATVLETHLRQVAAERGSAGGGIIDEALARVGRSDVPVAELVEAFRRHAPSSLATVPGAVELLRRARAAFHVGLVTDGDPVIQRAKITALGLADAFDVIVLSDELGREYRKPHPLPFLRALDCLGVTPRRAVFVGDNPRKDVAGPAAIGMRTVRVRSGEWSGLVSAPEPDVEVGDLRELLPWFGPTP